jgi:hypothetical protein
MKKINEIMNKDNLIITNKFKYNPPFNDETEDIEKTAEIINALFEKIASILPAFKQAWPNDAAFRSAKQSWNRTFRLANLTDLESIQKGIDKLMLADSAFVPSPGQFIKLCQEEDEPPKRQSNTMDWNLLESWSNKTDEDKKKNDAIRNKEMDNIRAILGIKKGYDDEKGK